MDQALSDFLINHRLPGSYLERASLSFIPVANKITALVKDSKNRRPYMVALVGCQGSGKSTLTDLFSAIWRSRGLKVASFSLDDLYLPKADRMRLSKEVHPLLATRGVPGTHDSAYLADILSSLNAGKAVTIPRFDKARDDRAHPDTFTRIDGRQDIVLIEGWCWGARSESAGELAPAANRLETEEDPDGTWRTYANRHLETFFEPLYASMDCWLMLKAPSFDSVYRWRLEQEQKLEQKHLDDAHDNRTDMAPATFMSAEQVRRFTFFFERITKRLLASMPDTADVVWHLDEQRQVQQISGKWAPLLEPYEASQDNPGSPVQ